MFSGQARIQFMVVAFPAAAVQSHGVFEFNLIIGTVVPVHVYLL